MECPAHPQIHTASQLAADAALKNTRAWIESEAEHLASLSPKEAAVEAVLRFHEEIGGKS